MLCTSVERSPRITASAIPRCTAAISRNGRFTETLPSRPGRVTLNREAIKVATSRVANWAGCPQVAFAREAANATRAATVTMATKNLAAFGMIFPPLLFALQLVLAPNNRETFRRCLRGPPEDAVAPQHAVTRRACVAPDYAVAPQHGLSAGVVAPNH